MSLIDTINVITSTVKGFNPISMKLTFALEKARARRLRQWAKQLRNILSRIEKADSKKNMKELTAQYKRYFDLVVRQNKMMDKEVKTEEKIEFRLAGKLKEVADAVVEDKHLHESVHRAIKAEESLAELQHQKLTYMQRGGTPWKGFDNTISSYDEGDCANILVVSAVNQRDMYNQFNDLYGKSKKKTKHYNRIIKDESAANQKTKLFEMISDMTMAATTLIHEIKKQFYVALRMDALIEDKLKHAGKHLKELELSRKLEPKYIERFRISLGLADQRFRRELRGEKTGAHKVIARLERAS